MISEVPWKSACSMQMISTGKTQKKQANKETVTAFGQRRIWLLLLLLWFPENCARNLRVSSWSWSCWSCSWSRCWCCWMKLELPFASSTLLRHSFRFVFNNHLQMSIRPAPSLHLSLQLSLSLCLSRVFLCCACAAHFEGNKSQTQTKRKMHWKKTNLWNSKTWAMAMEMLAACKLRLLVSKLSLTTRACAPRGEAWQPQVRIWWEEAAWEGWLLLWFLVNLKIFVFMTL